VYMLALGVALIVVTLALPSGLIGLRLRTRR
jgi:hypothetical protein